MNRTVELPSCWAETISKAPEAGMGYCIANITLNTGEVFTHVVIDSGVIVDVPGYGGIPFAPGQIADLKITNDKSRYRGANSRP